MGEGIITRRGGAGGLEINGQDTFSGLYQESINKFDPVYVDVLKNFDTVAKLTDPATLPTNIGRGVAFSQNNDYMSVAHFVSPFVTIYKRSGDTFTKLTNPATLPIGTGNGVAFSENNDYMSVAHDSSPFVTIYQKDNILASNAIFKSNNIITQLEGKLGAGYALQDGVKDDTKDIIRIWRDV